MTERTADVHAALEACGYRVIRELGRGGMGVVFQATQTALSREVAVKVILTGSSDVNLKRFRGEADALKSVRHPNVVRLLDVSLDSEPAFIVCEYIPGSRTLTDVLAADSTLLDRLRLARAILEGLAALHEQTIVHRDLKPANVLVDPDGDPKLIDFGLARALSSTTTRNTAEGSVLGTLAYMAPEQMSGDDVTLAADVYSWALLAMELVAGRALFAGTDAKIPFQERATTWAPDPREYCPALDAVVYRLIVDALERTPERRPPSAMAALARWPFQTAAIKDLPRTAVIRGPSDKPSASVRRSLPSGERAEPLVRETRPAPEPAKPSVNAERSPTLTKPWHFVAVGALSTCLFFTLAALVGRWSSFRRATWAVVNQRLSSDTRTQDITPAQLGDAVTVKQRHLATGSMIRCTMSGRYGLATGRNIEMVIRRGGPAGPPIGGYFNGPGANGFVGFSNGKGVSNAPWAAVFTITVRHFEKPESATTQGGGFYGFQEPVNAAFRIAGADAEQSGIDLSGDNELAVYVHWNGPDEDPNHDNTITLKEQIWELFTP